MPTPDIFDFDTDELAAYNDAHIDAALKSEPTLYLNHLRIAKHIDGWVESLEADDDDPEYVKALRTVAAHLRQGDYLPDGVLLNGI